MNPKMSIRTFLFGLVLACFSASSFGGTVTYSDLFGLNYNFLNIKETSALDTYLGSPRPMPTPAIDTLVISGGSLQVLTPSTSSTDLNVIQHAATTYSFDVVSKIATTSIDKLAINMSGQYALNSINAGATNNYAMVSIQIPMTIQLLATGGTPLTSAPSKGTGTGAGDLPNYTIVPSSVTVSANGIGNLDAKNGTWSASWQTSQNLNDLFNLPSMKITQLSLSVTPDLMAFRSISDLNTASATLTNASFQVIPEPSTLSLFGLAAALMMARRKSRRN